MLTQSQGFFYLSQHSIHEGAVGAQGVVGWHSQDSWPPLPDPRDLPYHRAPCSAYTAGGRRRGRWWCLSSQNTVWCDGALLSWRWLTISLPLQNGGTFPSFPCLHGWILLYMFNYIYLHPKVFSLLHFWFSLWSHWGDQWVNVWGLVAGWG